MSSASSRVPWTMAPIREVRQHVARLGAETAEYPQALAELEAAEPFWRRSLAEFAEHYGYLADLYYMSFTRSSRSCELDKAFAYWRRVEGIDGITGLVAYRLRLFGSQLEIARARRDGGLDAMSATLGEQCAKLRAELGELGAPTSLGDLANNTFRWATAAVRDRQWQVAADAFELAARAVDQLFRSVAVEERIQVLRGYPGYDGAAAGALFRAERFQDAVVTLEASRQRLTRFLRGISDLERVLSRDDPALLERVKADQAAWSVASDAYLEIADREAAEQARAHARAARERYLETLVLVRDHPKLKHYLIRPNWAAVSEAADESPVLYISSFSETLLFLVLPGGAIVYGHAPLTVEELRELLGEWLALLDQRSVATHRRRERALATLGHILEQSFTPALKETLTWPLSKDWKQTQWRWGPVTVVVAGPLSFIPVHAWAPTQTDSNDQITNIMPMMYAPSARQAATARRAPRPTGSSRSLLSIADPEPRPAGLAALPCARLETAPIAQKAHRRTLLYGPEASPEAVLRHAEEHEVLHFACHARLSPSAPTEGALELAGGKLTGTEILAQLALDHVALVVLTACRSGQQNPVVPDESLDLGSLFLAAGARAVVTNLWPVDDLAAALFVSRMFEVWNWGDGLPLPAAVTDSALWLRELTVRDLEAFAVEWPGWRLPVRRWTRHLDKDMKRFNEPYHWAGFSYSGG